MYFMADQTLLRAYKAAGGKNKSLLSLIEGKNEGRRWWASSVDVHGVSTEDLQLIFDNLKENTGYLCDASSRRTLKKIKAIIKLRNDGGRRITNLEVMTEAIIHYFRPLPHHWIFTEENEQQIPWHLQSVEFLPAEKTRGTYIPARIHIDLIAKRRGKEVEKTFQVMRGQLGTGVSPSALCESLGILPETEELYGKWEAENETYEDFVSMMGEQFWALGRGLFVDENDEDNDNDNTWGRRWGRGELNFEKNGGASKVVMDDVHGFGKKGKDELVYANSSLWRRGKFDDDNDDDDLDVDADQVVPSVEDENSGIVFALVQPFACVFSFTTHEFAEAHVANLTPYDYDKSLIDKLVLPPDHRKLVDVLISTSHRDAEDIVRGKRGGVVVLCSGSPGTGKTLTAEVYAEVAERPLYTAQCSQLGVDPEEIETELGKVLRRAMRWRAILLIDEADVYIHERGSDVNQNAIVGVFLRLLEYYAGIMFLTTNREAVVDDAIHSRCLAHVKYKIPDEQAREKIWRILATQYRIDLDERMIYNLVNAFPQISGRQIKQLCRLTQTMGEKPTMEQFLWLASFQSEIVLNAKVKIMMRKSTKSEEQVGD